MKLLVHHIVRSGDSHRNTYKLGDGTVYCCDDLRESGAVIFGEVDSCGLNVIPALTISCWDSYPGNEEIIKFCPFCGEAIPEMEITQVIDADKEAKKREREGELKELRRLKKKYKK